MGVPPPGPGARKENNGGEHALPASRVVWIHSDGRVKKVITLMVLKLSISFFFMEREFRVG